MDTANCTALTEEIFESLVAHLRISAVETATPEGSKLFEKGKFGQMQCGRQQLFAKGAAEKFYADPGVIALSNEDRLIARSIYRKTVVGLRWRAERSDEAPAFGVPQCAREVDFSLKAAANRNS